MPGGRRVSRGARSPRYTAAVSYFLRTLDDYCARYGVTPRDRRRLLTRWPLFRLAWEAEYGRGRGRSVARRLVPLFRRHVVAHEVEGGDGGRLEVPVSFGSDDLASFREIFFGDEYASPFDLSEARTLVDLGANTGMAALHFLSRAPLDRLVLVEANPALVPTLERNLSGHPVEVDRRAIVGLASTEPVRFFVSANHRHGSTSASVLLEGAEEISVEPVTLTTLLDQHGVERADILKMDIEGAEHGILEQDPEGLARARVLFAEVHGPEDQRDAFVRGIEALGFVVGRRTAQPHEGCETLVARRG